MLHHVVGYVYRNLLKKIKKITWLNNKRKIATSQYKRNNATLFLRRPWLQSRWLSWCSQIPTACRFPVRHSAPTHQRSHVMHKSFFNLCSQSSQLCWDPHFFDIKVPVESVDNQSFRSKEKYENIKQWLLIISRGTTLNLALNFQKSRESRNSEGSKFTRLSLTFDICLFYDWCTRIVAYHRYFSLNSSHSRCPNTHARQIPASLDCDSNFFCPPRWSTISSRFTRHS